MPLKIFVGPCCFLSQFNMTEENQLSFSYLEGCLRWAQKGHVGLDYNRPF